MTVKSKINIDVDSAEFADFKAKFDKYKDALKEMPGTWHEIGQSTAVAKTNFEAIVESIAVVGTGLAAITTSGKEFFHVTTATARHWSDLARSTKDVAGNIVRATESLLKWTGIISLITGGAGLFGFDRMAHSVMTQSIAAGGTGGNYGKRQAFLTNFRRFGDPEGMLAKVSRAQSGDFEALRDLIQLGLTKEEVMNGDPADVMAKAFGLGAEKASRPGAEKTFEINPQLKTFSLEQLKYLQGHRGEVGEQTAKMADDVKRFDVSKDDQKAYTNLVNKLEEAGKEIDTALVKGLIPLADPIKHLSRSTVRLVRKLMVKDGPVAHFIDDLAEALKWVDGKISDPKFNEKVDSFIGGIGDLVVSTGNLVKGLASLSRWLGISSAEAAPAAGGSSGLIGLRHAAGFGPSEGRYSGGSGDGRGQRSILQGGSHGGGASSLGPNAGDQTLSDAGGNPILAAIHRAAHGDIAREQEMRNIYGGESFHRDHWDHNANGEDSWGPFQLNRQGGEGADFERTHPGQRVSDPSTLDAQAEYVKGRLDSIHAHGQDPSRTWHGLRNPANFGHLTGGYAPNHKVTIAPTPGGNTVNQSNAAAGGSP